MKKKLTNDKRTLFMGIILIALGIVFSCSLSQSTGALGTVFIAVGGLFFISGMKKRAELLKKEM